MRRTLVGFVPGRSSQTDVPAARDVPGTVQGRSGLCYAGTKIVYGAGSPWRWREFETYCRIYLDLVGVLANSCLPSATRRPALRQSRK